MEIDNNVLEFLLDNTLKEKRAEFDKRRTRGDSISFCNSYTCNIFQNLISEVEQKDKAIDECIELIALIIRDVEENDIPLKIENLDEVLGKLQQAKGGCEDEC